MTVSITMFWTLKLAGECHIKHSMATIIVSKIKGDRPFLDHSVVTGKHNPYQSKTVKTSRFVIRFDDNYPLKRTGLLVSKIEGKGSKCLANYLQRNDGIFIDTELLEKTN